MGKTAVAEAIAQVLANGLREIDDSAKSNNPLNKAKDKIAGLIPNGKKKEIHQEVIQPSIIRRRKNRRIRRHRHVSES